MLEIVPITLVRTKYSFWLFRSGYKPGSSRESGDMTLRVLQAHFALP